MENLYANLTRLARQRGYPRPAALSPDEYLPMLEQAFPGQKAPLANITRVYMAVHYGGQPVSEEQLAALRRDYEQIRETEAKV